MFTETVDLHAAVGRCFWADLNVNGPRIKLYFRCNGAIYGAKVEDKEVPRTISGYQNLSRGNHGVHTNDCSGGGRKAGIRGVLIGSRSDGDCQR